MMIIKFSASVPEYNDRSRQKKKEYVAILDAIEGSMSRHLSQILCILVSMNNDEKQELFFVYRLTSSQLESCERAGRSGDTS
jgi:hypothetical protein